MSYEDEEEWDGCEDCWCGPRLFWDDIDDLVWLCREYANGNDKVQRDFFHGMDQYSRFVLA